MDHKALRTTEITLGAIGVLLLAAGILAIVVPSKIPWLIGIVLLAAAAANLVLFFKDGHNLIFSGALLVGGIMYLLFSILFFALSGGISTVLTILFAIALIGVGFDILLVTGVVRKFSDGKAWIGLLVTGLAAIILGIVAIAQPGEEGAGQQILGIAVGIILIVIGAAYLWGDSKLIGASRKKDPDEIGKYYKDVED